MAYHGSEQFANYSPIHESAMRYAQQQHPTKFYTRLSITALHLWCEDRRRDQKQLPEPKPYYGEDLSLGPADDTKHDYSGVSLKDVQIVDITPDEP